MSNQVIAKLVILMGTQTGEISINNPSMIIGRSPDVDIPLDDSRLSEKHCQIEYDHGKFCLTDLESKMGTFVNSKKIVRHELKDGDHIEVGNYIFRFEIPKPVRKEDKDKKTSEKEEAPSSTAVKEENHKPEAKERFELSKVRSIGPYRILEELGQGGFGRVYRVADPKGGKNLALKILLATSHTHVSRFYMEIQALAKIHHENIVEIVDVGEFQKHPYYTMEFISGTSLEKLLEESRFSQRESLEIVASLASTLHAAHQQNIVHRDVTPRNIIIQNDVPKIIDFGLVKDIMRKEQLTQSGEVIGTPHYMPPEQASGDISAIDSRSDIYSLGVILYQMLTGELPFKGESFVNIVFQILHEDPIPPRNHDPKIDILVEAICLKAIAKKKEDRYQTAEMFASDIRNFLGGKNVTARPLTVLRKSIRTALKVRVMIYCILVTLALIFVISFFYLNQARSYHNQIQTQIENLYNRAELALEAEHNLIDAEFYYRCLLDISPSDRKATNRLEEIIQARGKEAKEHLNRAKKFQDTKNSAAAVRELLLSLTLNPNLSESKNILETIQSPIGFETEPSGAKVRIYKIDASELGSRQRFQGTSPIEINERGRFLFVVEKNGYFPLIFMSKLTSDIQRVYVSLLPTTDNLKSMLAVTRETMAEDKELKVKADLLVDQSYVTDEEYARFHSFSGEKTSLIPQFKDAVLFASSYGKRLPTIDEWKNLLLPFCETLSYAPSPYLNAFQIGPSEWVEIKNGEGMAVSFSNLKVTPEQKAKTFRCVLDPSGIQTFIRNSRDLEDKIKNQHRLILQEERRFHQFLESYRQFALTLNLSEMKRLCQEEKTRLSSDNVYFLSNSIKDRRGKIIETLEEIPASLEIQLRNNIGKEIFLTQKDKIAVSGILRDIQSDCLIISAREEKLKIPLSEITEKEIIGLMRNEKPVLVAILTLIVGDLYSWEKLFHNLSEEDKDEIAHNFSFLENRWFFSKIQAEKEGKLFWSHAQEEWINPREAFKLGYVYLEKDKKWIEANSAEEQGYGIRREKEWLNYKEAERIGFMFLPDKHKWTSSKDYWSDAILKEILDKDASPYSLQFSQDGRYIAGGMDNGSVCIWSRDGWKQQALWTGHHQLVTWVDMTDGGTWCSSGWDGYLRIWKNSGKDVEANKISMARVFAASIDPSRKYILISDGKDIICWDVIQDKAINTFKGHKSLVHSIAFHPTDNWFASGDEDGNIILWNIETGKSILQTSSHKGIVFSLLFTPDGKRLISGGGDGKVRIWKIPEWEKVGELSDLYLRVFSLALSSDGIILAGAGADGKICIWDISKGKKIQNLEGHTEPVNVLLFSPDRTELISGGEDRFIISWRPQNNK